MNAAEIRSRFLKYFEQNGHTIVESSTLVPKDDPSLLFTNAGMVQFKKSFLGQEKRPYSRACTSQKCLRVGGKHNDLENVGRTARHHTFFEMLGNFSFGDYFKADAIRLAWDFITKEIKLPEEHLYVSIYKDDDEAGELWQSVAGIAPERIYRLGDKDNFWSMGDTGPCGPCSEIYVDQGADMSCGPDCGIGKCDCDRYLEIWNLVFMQFDQAADGTRTALPRPSIDTGMGLERIAAVSQGKRSNFETDLFTPLISYVADKAKVTYRADKDVDTALQVIADHSRSIAFLITDQILPSNEGRGYVLRRLIRRAFRFGRIMGLTDPFLHESVRQVVAQMHVAYPELLSNQEFMARVVREEEERFSQTLDKGLVILEDEIARLKENAELRISGEFAFKLYDTFGFPLDIVNDVAEKQGISVDEPGFMACMKEQKTRAKSAWKGSGEKDVASMFQGLLEGGVKTRFTGNALLEDDGRISALLDGEGESVESLTQGQGGWLVAASTPFYGESGGQEGDLGEVSTNTGGADVLETLKPSPQLTVHKIFVNEGDIQTGQTASLSVNARSRMASSRNHTATHLLHSALRQVLGDHVKQSGSLVGPERLRFDFTHIAPLTPQELARVEQIVNRAILDNIPVGREIVTPKEAVARGAMALFGEKYGDTVCLVEVPGVSMELCGGTHLTNTGQTGSFVILSETGVAAGIRRIEAATGWNALNYLQTLRQEMGEVQTVLKSRPEEVAARAKALNSQVKSLQKDLERLQTKLASGEGGARMTEVEDIGGVKVLAVKAEPASIKSLREQMDALKSKLPSGVACIIAPTEDGKVAVLISVSRDLHGKFTAPALIKDVAALVGGSGGGRPDMAQAGGNDATGIDKAIAKLKELVAAA